MLRWVSAHQNVELEQLVLIDAWKDRPAAEKLSYDASQAPHVDLVIVGQPKHDLRGAIEARLNIGEGVHAKGRRGPKVNYLETFPPRVHEHQVLRLQVAVDYATVLDVDHPLYQLE